jgi:hypothetical protein
MWGACAGSVDCAATRVCNGFNKIVKCNPQIRTYRENKSALTTLGVDHSTDSQGSVCGIVCGNRVWEACVGSVCRSVQGACAGIVRRERVRGACAGSVNCSVTRVCNGLNKIVKCNPQIRTYRENKSALTTLSVDHSTDSQGSVCGNRVWEACVGSVCRSVRREHVRGSCAGSVCRERAQGV